MHPDALLQDAEDGALRVPLEPCAVAAFERRAVVDRPVSSEEHHHHLLVLFGGVAGGGDHLSTRLPCEVDLARAQCLRRHPEKLLVTVLGLAPHRECNLLSRPRRRKCRQVPLRTNIMISLGKRLGVAGALLLLGLERAQVELELARLAQIQRRLLICRFGTGGRSTV